MTKNNLYYYEETYPSYTKEEAIEIITKFLVRKLEKLIKIGTVILSIVAVIALYKGEQVLKEANEVLARCEQNSSYVETLSVEEQFWKYIDSLEVPEQVQEVVNEITSVEYTQKDVELLAQLMYAEEGIFFRNYSENPQEVERVHKLAGSVVLHRAEIGYRGEKTVKGTIYSKGQYAEQTLDRVTQGQDIPEIVYTWAEELLLKGALGPRGMIYQAEFEQGDETYDEIGNQYFCIESKYN